MDMNTNAPEPASSFGSPTGGASNPNAQPAQAGQSPLAQQLQQFGRGPDSMMMHVTPNEVAGLQGLAQAAGGTLTTNPTTGLPEMGFLDNILPTVLGFALAPFTGGLSAAALVGGGEFLASGGNLQKGLMAGLGAFGGAGLAGGLGMVGGAASGAGTTAAQTAMNAVPLGTNAAAGAAASQAALNAVPMASNIAAATASPLAAGIPAAAAPAAMLAPSLAAPSASMLTAGTQAGGGAGAGMFGGFPQPQMPSSLSQFGNGFAGATGGEFGGRLGTGAAAMGLAQTASNAFQPALPTYQDPNAKWDYKGPYKPQDRQVSFPGATPTNGEYQYFKDSNPYPGFQPASANTGFASGGSALQVSAAPNRFAPIQADHIPHIMQQMGMPPQGMPQRPPMPDPQSFIQGMQRQPFNPQQWQAQHQQPPAGAAPPPGAPSAPQGQGEQNYGFKPMDPADSGSGIGSLMGQLPGNLGNILSQYDSSNPGALANAFNQYGSQNSAMQNTSSPGGDSGGKGTVIPSNFNPYAGATGLPVQSGSPTPTMQPFTPNGGPEQNYGFTAQPAAPPPSPSTYTPASSGGGGLAGLFGFGGNGGYGARFAEGGSAGGVPLENGAFIVDARTVSELGNGSSSAGQELLAKYGGQPLHGPGDGVSDSIPANIAGVQPAAVARDEVKFSPEAVARIGDGDLNKGTKKLYDMMARAQKARQSASRGQDTGLQGIMPK